MLKHFLKKFWRLLVAIGVLLTVLQGVLNIFPKIYYFFVSYINKTSLNLNIKSKLLLMLIGLTVLFLVALTLSILCILKKNKHNISPQIIGSNNKIKEIEYKPSKEEIQILLQFKNGKILSLKNLETLQLYSIDKTDLYFNNLLSNNFIKYHQETHYQDELDSILGNKRYEFSQKGREFLSENKQLD